MQLTLDAKQMGECLDLWRETLEVRFEDEDVRGTGADRLAALNKLSGTVDGWLDLLRVAKPETDADRGDLDAREDPDRELQEMGRASAVGFADHGGDEAHSRARPQARRRFDTIVRTRFAVERAWPRRGAVT
jgi:hypothetical protein